MPLRQTRPALANRGVAAVVLLCAAGTLFQAGAQTLANPDIVQPGQVISCGPTIPGVEWYRTDKSFVIDPENSQTMYLHVEWKGFYKSTDGGRTWSILTKGIKAYGSAADPNTPCYGEAPVALVDPTNSNRVILGNSGSPGTLTSFNSLSGGIFESLDGGLSFHQMEQNWMNTYNTDAVIFQPGNPNVLYYGSTAQPPTWTGAPQTPYVTKGIVYQTLDGGRTWTELPTGFVTNAGATGVHVDPNNPNNILVSTFSKNVPVASQMGLIRSLDRGNTWQKVTSLPPAYSAIRDDSVAALNFSHIFLLTQADAPNPPLNFYSTDGGVTFKPSGMYLDLAVHDPLDPAGNHMLGFAWEGMTSPIQKVIWESNDAGATWHALGNLPGEIVDPADGTTRPTNFVFDPKDRTKVYMNGASGYVWRSSDAGKTWTAIVDYTKLPAYTFPRTRPTPVISSVFNAADFSLNIAPNTFISIAGQNLAMTTRGWDADDFTGTSLPTELDQVQVVFYRSGGTTALPTDLNAIPAYVEYVSPGQINVLTPAGLSTSLAGVYVVQVYFAGIPSQYFPITVRFAAPAPFTYGAETGHEYVIATHADYSLIGPPSIYPGTTPARPNETIILWANGLGATNPPLPDGQLVTDALLVASPVVEVRFGVQPVSAYAALVGAGLYQLNATIPANMAAGEATVQISTAGGTSDGKATVFIQP